MRGCPGPKRTIAELKATAWALHCECKVKSEGAHPPGGQWIPVFLEVPELTQCCMSAADAHTGPPFPLEFPKEDEEVIVPNNLIRLCFHDYIGPQLDPAPPGHGNFSIGADQGRTLDFRKDPRLCPGCQYWNGSDSSLKGFP